MHPLSFLFFSCPFHTPHTVLCAVAALVSEAVTGSTQVTASVAQGIYKVGPKAKNFLHALKWQQDKYQQCDKQKDSDFKHNTKMESSVTELYPRIIFSTS